MKIKLSKTGRKSARLCKFHEHSWTKMRVRPYRHKTALLLWNNNTAMHIMCEIEGDLDRITKDFDHDFVLGLINES